jgi:peroxiredoxin Q/BCP
MRKKKVSIGDQVPEFKLMNQEGKWIDSKNQLGKPIVIYFYPKDNTISCTKEACAFRDDFHQFSAVGVKVFGFSADSVESHRKFRNQYRLPFDLLSDGNNKVRDAFGVEADLFGLIPGRATFIIDGKGVIVHMYSSQMNATKHVDESLRIIDGLNKIK